jgi:hypothetical protein
MDTIFAIGHDRGCENAPLLAVAESRHTLDRIMLRKVNQLKIINGWI